MQAGMKRHLPVSVAESRIIKRYDTIPTASLHPNADEIEYVQRLVVYKDSAVIILNKPPKVPVKGNLPVHNSMDVLAAVALSYRNKEGPKLVISGTLEVHRFDRDSSGLLLLGRSQESFARLNWLFSDINLAKTSCEVWNNACEATLQRYWALVIGCPEEKQGIISAPLSRLFLNDGSMEKVIPAHPSGKDSSQEAVTEYRLWDPPLMVAHVMVGAAFAYSSECIVLKRWAPRLWEIISMVGSYSRWKQMPRVDYEPSTGSPYKL